MYVDKPIALGLTWAWHNCKTMPSAGGTVCRWRLVRHNRATPPANAKPVGFVVARETELKVPQTKLILSVIVICVLLFPSVADNLYIYIYIYISRHRCRWHPPMLKHYCWCRFSMYSFNAGAVLLQGTSATQARSNILCGCLNAGCNP